MPVPTLSVRLRLGALALLASVLPLAVQAPAPTGGMAEGRPAAWLRAQVAPATAPEGREASDRRHAARAAFDQALARAQAADTRTLHDFLAAFLDAHADLTGAEAPATDGRSPRALIAQLRRQLAQAGLAVRPSTQMTTPPTAPGQRALWRVASLSVSFPEPLLAAVADLTPQPPSFAPVLASAASVVVAPVARATLFRVLFAGRRLGP